MFKRIVGSFSFNKLEPCLFALCILLTAWPVLVSKYYTTLDGPSHLYNASLIKELIFGQKDNISDLYCFNPVLVPNWTGHFIMAFFGLFFPAFLAQKLMMLIYFILTPLFFRKSLLFFEPKNRFGLYLIFPLLHNHLFYFGFFNMCLGITAMFASLSYFLNSDKKITVKQYIFLTLLLGITFFSHIITFLLTIALLIAFSTVFLDVRKNKNHDRIADFSGFKKRLIWIFICAIPSLILSINYFVKIHATGPRPLISLAERLQWILDFRPVMAFGCGPPLLDYGRVLSALFGFLIAVFVFLVIKNKKLFPSNTVFFDYRNTVSSIIFLTFCIVLLILYFLLPNFILISDRLLVLFYVFFFCWLALIKFPKWIGGLSLVAIITLQANIVSVYYNYAIETRDDVPKLEKVATSIPEGNLVLVLNYSANWLYDHASGYIGANRRLALLENYEARLQWFPVNWNPERFNTDTLAFGAPNKDLICSFFVNEPDSLFFSVRQKNGLVIPVDYVVQIGENPDKQTACFFKTKTRLETSYKIIRWNNFCKLYFRKQK
ncbi:MAG TPA: hypothetical protein PL029_09060 [Bacteroidia bacterium]|nr:hypothetical protein [Bacteroidia bacterium]